MALKPDSSVQEAIYWAIKKLDDLVGEVRFTIRRDHRNLIDFSNCNSGSYIFSITMLLSNVPGEMNISTDKSSRLVPEASLTAVNQIVVPQFTNAQRLLMQYISIPYRSWYTVHEPNTNSSHLNFWQ